MSVQFGMWNWDGRPTDREHLEKVKTMLAPYGPDGWGSYGNGNIGILSFVFHTTKESQHETQPHCTTSGAVIACDGRLDNREYLISRLRGVLTGDSTDLSLVAAAYETWGLECFAELIGDWAISIWNPNDRSLILAKDPIGTRHLYYRLDENQATWSSLLDPLLLCSRKTFQLQEEYLAGWLAHFPACHLTPYVGIHAVPPCSFVMVQPDRRFVRQYWDFDPTKRIRYPREAEYEDHFRDVLAQAVRRRLRSHMPILAELSGGMDSSAIVCVADKLLRQEGTATPRLDTISYYDESEPNWNESPYFKKVEEQRGQTGCHIRVDSAESFGFETANGRFASTPASIGRHTDLTRKFAFCLNSRQSRVVLSGLGGDEVTGGVPTPVPELADYIAACQLKALVRQLKAWALQQRKPWLHLLFEAVRGFLPLTSAGMPSHRQPPRWLKDGFVERNRPASIGYERRLRVFGPRPSFQENLLALDQLRRQLGCSCLSLEPLHERRYPFLDRDLLEFLFSIPREQLVRPGHRRSLMRRALAGIVPDEVLTRKRKASVTRAPVQSMMRELPALTKMLEHSVAASLGIVNPAILTETLPRACRGEDIPMIPVFRALTLELWLRNIKEHSVCDEICHGSVGSAAA